MATSYFWPETDLCLLMPEKWIYFYSGIVMYDPLPTYLIFLFMLSSLTHSKVCRKRSDLFSGKHKYVLIFHIISRYWIVYRYFRRNIIVCLVFISCIELETSHLVMIHSNSVKKTVISPFHIIDTMATNILEPSYQQTWFGLTFSGIYPSLNVMSWNHLFRITVPLWRESTDHQWISLCTWWRHQMETFSA